MQSVNGLQHVNGLHIPITLQQATNVTVKTSAADNSIFVLSEVVGSPNSKTTLIANGSELRMQSPALAVPVQQSRDSKSPIAVVSAQTQNSRDNTHLFVLTGIVPDSDNGENASVSASTKGAPASSATPATATATTETAKKDEV